MSLYTFTMLFFWKIFTMRPMQCDATLVLSSPLSISHVTMSVDHSLIELSLSSCSWKYLWFVYHWSNAGLRIVRCSHLSILFYIFINSMLWGLKTSQLKSLLNIIFIFNKNLIEYITYSFELSYFFIWPVHLNCPISFFANDFLLKYPMFTQVMTKIPHFYNLQYSNYQLYN